MYVYPNRDKCLVVATPSFTRFGDHQATDRLFNYSCNKHY